jgi:hypothetical protein
VKTRRTARWMAWLLVAAVGLSACTIHVDRNDDGSLRAESRMPEGSIQEEIALALRDAQVKELDVDLRQGYVQVTGVREMPVGGHTDTLRFNLTLGVADGHLTATIWEATFNDNPIAAERVAGWNERIARNLERRAGNHPNSTLQSVSVTPDAVTMAWRIETRYSRGE